ncbi:unnamed protein product [Ostreobium quekettii]|uniref:Uncharacterized protein n=1 Tax=Ostreobium quekettii TaxID=121088 RepID=A0A8S1ILI4_9CHLO|nr:unnamed protein product [Ostreobium quekettii]|eukprot:evm.model.scf_692.3 EVM.evm.TU.scf_692.3   scf_692:28174-28987(+)
MSDSWGSTPTSLRIDDLLMEVDAQIKLLDQRVASCALQLQFVADVEKLQDLVGAAMEANQRAADLWELQLLLMDQRRKEGSSAHVPKAVFEILWSSSQRACEEPVARI